MTPDLLWIEKNHGTAIDVNSILFPHLWEWHSKTLLYWWFRTSTYYHRANCNNLAAKCDYIILADHWPLPFYSAVANPNDFTNSPDSALIQKKTAGDDLTFIHHRSVLFKVQIPLLDPEHVIGASTLQKMFHSNRQGRHSDLPIFCKVSGIATSGSLCCNRVPRPSPKGSTWAKSQI